MTARQPPRPNGLNAVGNGKGLKVVTRPVTKKRGASVGRTKAIADNRRKYKNAANIPTALVAETIDPNKPLTEKAKLFVKYWAQGESITAASARAGYGDGASYAYKLVHFPQAVALYKEEKRLYEEASQMTRKKVMDGLLEGIELAKIAGEPASMINGWKTIGQMCGYFEPVKRTIDVNVKGSVEVRKLNRMTDADLLKVIQEGVEAELQLLEQEDRDDDDA